MHHIRNTLAMNARAALPDDVRRALSRAFNVPPHIQVCAAMVWECGTGQKYARIPAAGIHQIDGDDYFEDRLTAQDAVAMGDPGDHVIAVRGGGIYQELREFIDTLPSIVHVNNSTNEVFHLLSLAQSLSDDYREVTRNEIADTLLGHIRPYLSHY